MIVYHSTQANIQAGARFTGSNREKLSDLLGGDVGFAYPCFPEDWDEYWEVEVPDNNPVCLSLNGETIPRRDYVDLSFEDAIAGVPCYLLGEKIQFKGFVGVAKDLIMFKEAKGEVAFLAKDSFFKQKVK